MELNTLYQDPDGRFTHVELRTSPKQGRLVLELFIMLERLETYLNKTDKSSPEDVLKLRYLHPINVEASYRHSQAH